MDQVLFSEPSTKMKEQMEQIRAEEAKRVIREQESELGLNSSTGDDGSSTSSSSSSSESDRNGSAMPDDAVTDEEQKFLEDRFGKQ